MKVIHYVCDLCGLDCRESAMLIPGEISFFQGEKRLLKIDTKQIHGCYRCVKQLGIDLSNLSKGEKK